MTKKILNILLNKAKTKGLSLNYRLQIRAN